jgi:hypothetical protein
MRPSAADWIDDGVMANLQSKADLEADVKRDGKTLQISPAWPAEHNPLGNALHTSFKVH